MPYGGSSGIDSDQMAQHPGCLLIALRSICADSFIDELRRRMGAQDGLAVGTYDGNTSTTIVARIKTRPLPLKL